MGPDATLALTIGGGLLQGGTGLFSSLAGNRAAKSASDQAQRAATVEQLQLRRAAALERLKTKRTADQVRGAMLAAAYERGGGRIVEAMLRALDVTESLDLATIGENERAGINESRARAETMLSGFNSRRVSPLLGGALGLLEGAGVGLRLGVGLEEVEAMEAARAATIGTGAG